MGVATATYSSRCQHTCALCSWMACTRARSASGRDAKANPTTPAIRDKGRRGGGEGFSLVARSRDGGGSSATSTARTNQGSDDHDG